MRNEGKKTGGFAAFAQGPILFQQFKFKQWLYYTNHNDFFRSNATCSDTEKNGFPNVLICWALLVCLPLQSWWHSLFYNSPASTLATMYAVSVGYNCVFFMRPIHPLCCPPFLICHAGAFWHASGLLLQHPSQRKKWMSRFLFWYSLIFLTSSVYREGDVWSTYFLHISSIKCIFGLFGQGTPYFAYLAHI